jgi:hypothetical protein
MITMVMQRSSAGITAGGLTVIAAPPAATVGTVICPARGGVTGGVTGTTGSTTIAPAGLASVVTGHTPVGAMHILAKLIHMPDWKHSVYS